MLRCIVCCICILLMPLYGAFAEDPSTIEEHSELLKMEKDLVKAITGKSGTEDISPRMEPQVREFIPAEEGALAPVRVKALVEPKDKEDLEDKRRSRDRAIADAVNNIIRDIPEDTTSRARMNPEFVESEDPKKQASSSDYVISRKVVYVDDKNDGKISSISIKPEVELYQDHALDSREQVTFRSYDDENDMWDGEQIPLFYHGRVDPELKKQVETNSTGIASVLQKQREADKRGEERFKKLEAKIDKIANSNAQVESLEKQVAKLAAQNDDLLQALGDLKTEVRSQPTHFPAARQPSSVNPAAFSELDSDPYLDAVAQEQPSLTKSAFFGGYNEQLTETMGTVLHHHVPGFDGPGTFYSEILRFERGARVHITSVRDGWARIRTDQGDTAWVRATDIRFS